MPAVTTDWVSHAQAISGRDHLAVQAVSEQIYSALIPGITNVTDRVRCYSFYPWFVWAFDQESRTKNVAEFTRLFRRAECLHTLVGIAHELKTKQEWPHGANLVGRDTLVGVARSILAGNPTRLSRYADLGADPSNRYFKNQLGGLGQYYLGPLKKDLQVLDGDSQKGLKYTKEWGQTLAQEYDKTVDRTAFFQSIQRDRIDDELLSSLVAFCPCSLRRNEQERLRLTDLLLCRGEGELKQEFGHKRRGTLLLLLHFAKGIKSAKGIAVTPSSFLDSAYTSALPGERAWNPPESLRDIRQCWGIYLRHELLAVAVQGLFWAGLAALADDGGFVSTVSAYASWFEERFRNTSASLFGRGSLQKAIDGRRALLPHLSDFEDESHEVNLAETARLAQMDHKPDEVVDCCSRLLLALLTRDYQPAQYGTLTFPDDFFSTYEVNLLSLQRYAEGEWANMPATDWFGWLATNWAIRVHLRVGFRKLRHQLQDSFRIVPLEDGLTVREAPLARWSSPRLQQALQFLGDLGLLDQTEGDGELRFGSNAKGEQLLEVELART